MGDRIDDLAPAEVFEVADERKGYPAALPASHCCATC